jgi:hypothetical protein
MKRSISSWEKRRSKLEEGDEGKEDVDVDMDMVEEKGVLNEDIE